LPKQKKERRALTKERQRGEERSSREAASLKERQENISGVTDEQKGKRKSSMLYEAALAANLGDAEEAALGNVDGWSAQKGRKN